MMSLNFIEVVNTENAYSRIKITSDSVNDKIKSMKIKTPFPGVYVNRFKVKFAPEIASINGLINNPLKKIPLSIDMKFDKIVNDDLHFVIEKMSPVDNDDLNKLIFKKMNFVTYSKSNIVVHMNKLRGIANFPSGRIRQIDFVEGAILGEIEIADIQNQ